MNDAARTSVAARPMTPQENLRAARSGLATALAAAQAAVNEPSANAAMIGAAMTGLAQAQQNYNNAVIRIPLRIMTDGEIPPADTAGPEGPQEVRAEHLHAVDAGAEKVLPENELLESTNARKWADHFLAINKNKAIDRETLTGWFANAIEAGRSAGESGRGSTAVPEDPFPASINRLAAAIEKAADRLR